LHPPDSRIVLSNLLGQREKIDKPTDDKQTCGEDIQNAHSDFVNLKLMYPDEPEKKPQKRGHP